MATPQSCFGFTEDSIAYQMQILRDKYWNWGLENRPYAMALDYDKFIEVPQTGAFKVKFRFRCPEACDIIVQLFHNDRTNIGWFGI